uniref:BZIP domain-containing protein n=1 Tax=Panagrellus redivivus TaxID=6233 RepID=A0A7E4UY17_PANRE
MEVDGSDTVAPLKSRPTRLSAPGVGVFATPQRNYTVRRSKESRAQALERALAKRAEKKAKNLAAIEKRLQARRESLAKRAQSVADETTEGVEGEEVEADPEEPSAEGEEAEATPSASVESTQPTTPEPADISFDENGRPKRKCIPNFEYLKTNRTYTRKAADNDKMREVRIKAAEKRKQRLAAKRERAAFMRSKTNRALRAAALSEIAAEQAEAESRSVKVVKRHPRKRAAARNSPKKAAK